MPQSQFQPYPKRTPFFNKAGEINEEWHRWFLSTQTLVNRLLLATPEGFRGAAMLGLEGLDPDVDQFVIPGPPGPAGGPGPQGARGTDGEDADRDDFPFPLFPNGVTGAGSVALATNPAFLGTPTAPTQPVTDNSTKIASTAYVTTAVANAIAAVNPAVAVQAATNAILPNSPVYFNGVAGIGATITAGVTNATLVVDGYMPALGDRILVKNEASGGGLGASRNGVYTVTTLAALAVAWVLTRALDYDQPSDINNTGAIPVVNGTANTQTQWVVTSAVATIGTDAITFTQFSLNPTTVVVGPASATSGDIPIFSGTTGKLLADGGKTLASVGNYTVATSAATGAQNNFAPGISGNTLVTLTGAAPAITGLAGGVTGQIVIFKNTGTGVATFAHNDGGSSAGNKLFNVATSLVTPIAAGGFIIYQYDGTQWQLISHLQGPAVSYTPAWTSSGVAPVLGNGTLTGTYGLVGNIITVAIVLTIGSTTTLGTGDWFFSNPGTITAQGPYFVGDANHVGVGGTSTLALAVSGTTFEAVVLSSFAVVGAAVPFAWATADSLLQGYQNTVT